MAVDLERVQSALRSAISESQKPTQAQVVEISGLTRIEEALKEIQRMIRRRIQYADQYPPAEVYHTLVLMQKCLSSASRHFVAFCTTLLPIISVLTHYELPQAGSGAAGSNLNEISGLIRSRASSLCGDLVNPTQLSEKRHTLLGEEPTSMTPPPTHVSTHPLPTPPAEYKFLPSAPPRNIGLPTPDPSPEAFTNLSLDNSRTRRETYRAVGCTFRNDTSAQAHDSAFASLLSLKSDDVARLTFKSEDLALILRILDDCIKPDSTPWTDPNDLVKALTLVHHCLSWGSHDFVTHFQRMKPVLNALRRHPVTLVRSRADTVVALLEDTSRLQQQRESRARIMGQNPAPPTPTLNIGALQESPSPLAVSQGIRGKVREPVLDLTKYVKRIGTRAVTGGGYSDVWQGEYQTESEGVVIVAIKILRRLSKVSSERLDKRRNRELRAWRKVQHKNITPFYGIIIDQDNEIGMISPYYSDGNIIDYLKKNRKADPLTKLQEIAEGLSYLHSQKIVHGDVKGSNVMVNGGTPMLIDFGLAQFIDEFAEETGYTTSNIATSLRWSAPELLIGDPATSSKTEKSDVYAFASLSIEIMTLRSPYYPKRDPQVMGHVLKGGIPDRPSMEDPWSPVDELWEFLQLCWKGNPQDRPDIQAVRRKLAEFYTFTPSGSERVATLSSGVAWSSWRYS